MDVHAPEWLVAIETSGVGAAIRQSVWIYPAANVGHVVAVVCFAASVALLDLTLLGIVRPAGRARLIGAVRRWTMAFLALVALSGLVLFTAEASHVAMNRVFQIKLALIAIAILNGLILGRRAETALVSLDDGAPVPAEARVAAALSLSLWLVVAALGRFIAYN